jgi:hypothetical protein
MTTGTSKYDDDEENMPLYTLQQNLTANKSTSGQQLSTNAENRVELTSIKKPKVQKPSVPVRKRKSDGEVKAAATRQTSSSKPERVKRIRIKTASQSRDQSISKEDIKPLLIETDNSTAETTNESRLSLPPVTLRINKSLITPPQQISGEPTQKRGRKKRIPTQAAQVSNVASNWMPVGGGFERLVTLAVSCEIT